MRSKQAYILVERNGKQAPQKVSMAPVQRHSFKVEFDVFIDIDSNAVTDRAKVSQAAQRPLHANPAPVQGCLLLKRRVSLPLSGSFAV
jgi:hypothetical protein